ncbi:type III polyketide synthase [Leucobacter sp. USHLN153]|uniref:type III polyketide synthase n=1 Tax=Leucobacter sp. USHLN153 TaxID=3081268 RepID=UPI00301684C8
MVSRILAVGTAVPSTRLAQPQMRDFFAAQPGADRLTQRLIGAAFDQSAIDTRYSVIGGLGAPAAGESAPDAAPHAETFVQDRGELRHPTTGERNRVYREEAPRLTSQAARDALDRAGVAASAVTHVVTASCTGFFAPGPDFLLVRDLGIPTSAERTHIGFMGCAAAFPALRAATRIAQAEPGSVILVVCTELCSLHIRSSSDPEQIVASAVFGDGAAAAVVASDPLPARRSAPSLVLGDFSTAITAEGEEDMDWTIGDHGFEMRLTSNVPRIIGREIAGVVGPMLADDQSAPGDIDAWAVHPGGRSVLDRVQSGLELPADAMTHSREVLREYGNMSSATVLFILQRILADDSIPDGASVAGLCFGPGLTVETARFVREGANRSGADRPRAGEELAAAAGGFSGAGEALETAAAPA